MLTAPSAVRQLDHAPTYQAGLSPLSLRIVDGHEQVLDEHPNIRTFLDTQLDRFTSEPRFLAIAVLESADDARNDSLKYDIQQLLQWRLVEGERIVIAQNADGLKVDIEPVDTDSGTATDN